MGGNVFQTKEMACAKTETGKYVMCLKSRKEVSANCIVTCTHILLYLKADNTLPP